MKILGFDLGDRWTGVAATDPLGMLCKPLKTVETCELAEFLNSFLQDNAVGEIVYGIPLNQYGLEGEQAKKINLLVEELKKNVTNSQLSAIKFVAWDERRTSLLAANFLREKQSSKSKNKTVEHSIAAAFILQNYIDFKSFEQGF